MINAAINLALKLSDYFLISKVFRNNSMFWQWWRLFFISRAVFSFFSPIIAARDVILVTALHRDARERSTPPPRYTFGEATRERA
jgi:hypothetical protein